jgi:hypothetical protein
VKDSFEFVDAGRRFECSVEKMRKASPETWWWFRVSTDEQNRYAPFRAEDGDTQSSVQARVVAYYDDLLVRRAAPPVNRWQRGAPKPATDQPVAEAAAAQSPEAPPPA